MYKASYYTRVVLNAKDILLFNGFTGALVVLTPETFPLVEPFLGQSRSLDAGVGLDKWDPPHFDLVEIKEPTRGLIDELLKGGFFVSEDFDEQAAIRNRYNQRSQTAPLFIRITTTLDCNYNCYYCFEDKSKVQLTRSGCDSILNWTFLKIRSGGHKSLFTSWFGGEPMLNHEAIEYISKRIILHCKENSIHYSSAIISNGSLWPSDPLEFVHRCKIENIQFTLDGPPDHHRRRRRLKDKRAHGEDSFDAVIRLVDALYRDVKIVLRINVDPEIDDSVYELIPFFEAKGWLSEDSNLIIQLALIGPMNEHCASLDTKKFQEFRSRFQQIQTEFNRQISEKAASGAFQSEAGGPIPLNLPCSAVSQNSVIFGPDGLTYKCVLDIGDPSRAFGTVIEPRRRELSDVNLLKSIENSPSTVGSRAHPYLDYDPVAHERCGQCQYLPVCLGGCPKDQFEQNQFYLQERSEYWERNFETIVRARASSAI
jgi:uncharacterized protein